MKRGHHVGNKTRALYVSFCLCIDLSVGSGRYNILFYHRHDTILVFPASVCCCIAFERRDIRPSSLLGSPTLCSSDPLTGRIPGSVCLIHGNVVLHISVRLRSAKFVSRSGLFAYQWNYSWVNALGIVSKWITVCQVCLVHSLNSPKQFLGTWKVIYLERLIFQ